MTIRIGRTRRALTGAVVACAAALFTMAPASAGTTPINATPTSLHAGESVSVSGYCRGTIVRFSLYAGWVNDWSLPDSDAVSLGTITVDEGLEVNWSGDVMIPEGTAPGTYTLYSLCDSAQSAYSYRFVEITVLATQDSTTTTKVTTAPTTTVAPVVAPAATPAAPVTAKPTYTG